jgi:signal-transduction protein with cAMP-binding, CBS, and nucleotidyltransferase domain
MYLPGKPHEATELLSARMQQLTKGLLDGFPIEQEPLSLEGIDDLYQHFDNTQIFLITDGILHLAHDGQNIVSFDEGDLIGFTRAFDLPFPTLRAEEFVELKLIDRDSLLHHIYSDKRRQHYWSHFLMCQNSILLNHLAELSREQTRTTAGFQNFQAGDVIIKEGDEAEHVYTIISGEADVFADGVKVGKIGVEEVFGAMAVFTGEKRSATVQARTACTIMAVPQNEFVHLIKAQPQAAVNLIENLARRIVALNHQVIEQQK